MNSPCLRLVSACAATLALFGCGKEGSGPASMQGGVEEKVPPYAYPAPVKGHLKETNIGDFGLVDGIAYPSVGGSGTVVYVTSKSIASPMLVDSECPLTQARALSVLRNASYGEVTLDAAGRSTYFAAGAPFGRSLTDLSPGGRYWSSALRMEAGRAAGNVVHREYGRFEFELPMSHPKFDVISLGDRERKRELPANTPKPAAQAVTAAYSALRDAALKKNPKAMLAALGFDAKQNAAIRGMEGIETDFTIFADRFLAPGTPGDPSVRAGAGRVRGEGVKSNGNKFTNDYYFDLCGDRLVLTRIIEHPQ